MKPRDFTPEEAARIELHTQSAHEEKAARRQHYRAARMIRIADGIVEHGDLVDEHDVVCPHCGTWATDVAGHPRTVELVCLNCQQPFELEVRVSRSYITSKLEPEE